MKIQIFDITLRGLLAQALEGSKMFQTDFRILEPQSRCRETQGSKQMGP